MNSEYTIGSRFSYVFGMVVLKLFSRKRGNWDMQCGTDLIKSDVATYDDCQKKKSISEMSTQVDHTSRYRVPYKIFIISDVHD